MMPESTPAPGSLSAPEAGSAPEGAKAIFRAPRAMVWFMRFAAVFCLFVWGVCLSAAVLASGRDAVVLPIAGTVVFAPFALLCYWLARRMQDRVEVDGSTIAYVRLPRGGWMMRWEEVTEMRETFGYLGPYLELSTRVGGIKPLAIQWGYFAHKSDFAVVVYSCFRSAHGGVPGTTTLPVSFRLWGVPLVVVVSCLFAFLAGAVVGADDRSYGWLGTAAGWWLLALVIGGLMMITVNVTVDQGGLVLDRLAKRCRYGFEKISGVDLDWNEVSVFVSGRRSVGKWVSLGIAKEGTLLMYYTLFFAWQAWKKASAGDSKGAEAP